MLTKIGYDYLRTLILPLREIDHHIPKEGRILDLGCGEGVISIYLAKDNKRFITGVDKDKSRIKKVNIKNIEFKSGDITKISIKNFDGIIISDVLHHLSFKSQKILLKKIANGIKKGGVVVIKEIDTDELIRSKLSRIWDFLLYPKDKISFSNSRDMGKLLNDNGLRVSVIRPCRLFPGSTTLYICKKR